MSNNIKLITEQMRHYKQSHKGMRQELVLLSEATLDFELADEWKVNGKPDFTASCKDIICAYAKDIIYEQFDKACVNGRSMETSTPTLN